MSSEYTKPLPRIDALTKPFWDHAREGRLAVQMCDVCGHAHFPPSPVCPECLSDSQSWKAASGRGTLESWVEFHRAYWPGFKDTVPYQVCLVRLEEGPLLVSNLMSGLSGGARAPWLGAPVHAVFDRVTDDVTLPKFELD